MLNPTRTGRNFLNRSNVNLAIEVRNDDHSQKASFPLPIHAWQTIKLKNSDSKGLNCNPITIKDPKQKTVMLQYGLVMDYQIEGYYNIRKLKKFKFEQTHRSLKCTVITETHRDTYNWQTNAKTLQASITIIKCEPRRDWETK